MARQHKGEVMIAGEQLRYEERKRWCWSGRMTCLWSGLWGIQSDRSNIWLINFKVEATRWKTDQGPTLPPAHVSKLLCGTGTYRLAGEP